MKKYNIHEAKTNLSKILNVVQEEGGVYIARADKIVAEIKPITEKKPFPFGLLKDQIIITEDWDDPATNDLIAELFDS